MSAPYACSDGTSSFLASVTRLTVMLVKHWMMELENGFKHTRMRKSTV